MARFAIKIVLRDGTAVRGPDHDSLDAAFSAALAQERALKSGGTPALRPASAIEIVDESDHLVISIALGDYGAASRKAA